MATKIEKLLESYQGNAYPAMLEDLAAHLGVTESSLRQLALGWAPIVEFKKGKNFMGWWVIPERDDDATPVGLSLRSQNDMKVMCPGSKHGLVYAVNPEHQYGDKGYDAGAHNWVRLTDAGLPCPVCGKPDGCLLSAENPSDPRAVVCIRTSSPKRLRMGHLHILKAEGDLKGRSPLADNGGPVLVVEGMSDTAAAMDLGYIGVGRPSNLACMDLLTNLVRGRHVIVVGENDKKPDGSEPGREGMIAAFQVIRNVCTAKMLMPPTHVKDLRAWKAKYGLTREELDAYIESNGETHAPQVVIPDSRPLTIARSYLDGECRLAGRYTIKRWAENWHRYSGGKYVRVSEEAFEKPIYQWSHDKLVQNTNPANGAVSLAPLVANQTLVANVQKAIIAETLVEGLRVPCWINDTKGQNPYDLIVFNNGILDVPAFIRNDEKCLLDPTPDLFTTAALPFAFDPTAQCPMWKTFLRTTLGDDQNKIKLLREWFGYCMTTDTSEQKMMFMRGPTAAGKSEIMRVLSNLVGRDQTAATSFSDLSGAFGLQPLIGKMLCVIGDARTPRNGDVMRGLELLLNIVGNDDVSINRKHKEQIDLSQLMVRITIASNEFLDLPDHANALLRRLLILEFQHSFVGREDTTLRKRLETEVPGIAVWALTGLRRLREQKGFTIPESTKEAMLEWRVATNPLSAFVEECCDIAPNTEVLKSELFDAWVAWVTERRINQITRSRFYERMRSACPTATTATYEKGIHKISVYRGLKLKAWAARKFIGRP